MKRLTPSQVATAQQNRATWAVHAGARAVALLAAGDDELAVLYARAAWRYALAAWWPPEEDQ